MDISRKPYVARTFVKIKVLKGVERQRCFVRRKNGKVVYLAFFRISEPDLNDSERRNFFSCRKPVKELYRKAVENSEKFIPQGRKNSSFQPFNAVTYKIFHNFRAL